MSFSLCGRCCRVMEHSRRPIGFVNRKSYDVMYTHDKNLGEIRDGGGVDHHLHHTLFLHIGYATRSTHGWLDQRDGHGLLTVVRRIIGLCQPPGQTSFDVSTVDGTEHDVSHMSLALS